MTDRVNALVVVLEKDIREDDIEPLANAIRELRGVLRVSKNVVNIDSYVASTRAENLACKILLDTVETLRKEL